MAFPSAKTHRLNRHRLGKHQAPFALSQITPPAAGILAVSLSTGILCSVPVSCVGGALNFLASGPNSPNAATTTAQQAIPITSWNGATPSVGSLWLCTAKPSAITLPSGYTTWQPTSGQIFP